MKFIKTKNTEEDIFVEDFSGAPIVYGMKNSKMTKFKEVAIRKMRTIKEKRKWNWK